MRVEGEVGVVVAVDDETADAFETSADDEGEVEVEDGEEAAVDGDLPGAALYPFAPAKSAATFGFELRKPAVTSPSGHPPPEHGLLLQQPINGGVVAAQVYHWLPAGHS